MARREAVLRSNTGNNRNSSSNNNNNHNNNNTVIRMDAPVSLGFTTEYIQWK